MNKSSLITKPYFKRGPSPPKNDNEYSKLISSETKRFCSELTQANFEFKAFDHCNLELSNQINDLIQSSPIQLQSQIDKLKLIISFILNDDSNFRLIYSNNDESMLQFMKSPLYFSCLNETCTEICLIYPTLLSRQTDLIFYAQKIVNNCVCFNENEKQLKFKRSMYSNENKTELVKNKPQTLDADTPFKQNVQNQFANNFTTLYTAALALHLQQNNNNNQESQSGMTLNNINLEYQKSQSTSMLENNDLLTPEHHLRMTLQNQDDFKSKLMQLSTQQNLSETQKVENMEEMEGVSTLLENYEENNGVISPSNNFSSESSVIEKSSEVYFDNENSSI